MNQPDQPNQRTLKLTLLGIGGAFDADMGIANTGAVMEIVRHDPNGSDEVETRILIDCGHTCGRQLRDIGLTYEHIDTILITHAHGDHIDGLEVVGYKSRFLYNRNIRLIAIQEVLDQIWCSLSPKMGRLQTTRTESLKASLSDYFTPQPASLAPLSLADGRIHVRFVPVHHVHGMPAYALLFSLGDNNARVRWSGDTIFNNTHAMFEDFQPKRGDFLFHDCTFLPYYDATVHTHHSSLMTLPEAIRTNTVLVHHGKLETDPERRGDMILGQPFDTYTFAL